VGARTIRTVATGRQRLCHPDPQGCGIKISMDGRGRRMDNIFIERLWRTRKYECVYLHAFETGSAVREGIARWVTRYNQERPHSSLNDHTPDEIYHGIITAGGLK